MRLRLIREPTIGETTLGVLFVNGVFRCWTLEDAIRERPGEPVAAWKVPRQTAIPAGTYPVQVNWSVRFDRLLPEIQNVPGFSGIRIHTGNRHTDTEGCVLVGFVRANGVIEQSRPALAGLMDLLTASPDGAELVVENPSMSE